MCPREILETLWYHLIGSTKSVPQYIIGINCSTLNNNNNKQERTMNLFDIWLITMIVSVAINFILVALLFVKIFEKKELQEKLYQNNDDFLKVINTLRGQQRKQHDENREWVNSIQIQKRRDKNG
tara:strand:+ start:224 stop:598 length:375 start_codon:yes stop_codon:yes gene_type:complete